MERFLSYPTFPLQKHVPALSVEIISLFGGEKKDKNGVSLVLPAHGLARDLLSFFLLGFQPHVDFLSAVQIR